MSKTLDKRIIVTDKEIKVPIEVFRDGTYLEVSALIMPDESKGRYLLISGELPHSKIYNEMRALFDGIWKKKETTENIGRLDGKITSLLEFCKEHWQQLYYDEHLAIRSKIIPLRTAYTMYVREMPNEMQEKAKYSFISSKDLPRWRKAKSRFDSSTKIEL